MKPMLTVFTPTYNRAYTLHLCYESLKRQSCKSFVWLIIDDGSTDQTKELVAGWMAEKIIPIRYRYQENQGMHGAHNTAYELVDTELNVCIDSDDYMADDAVEKITSFWQAEGNKQYAGIVGLDISQNQELIGTRLPEQLKSSRLTDLYALHHVKGDKKIVYRSEITSKYPPYPLFQGEKYCPLSYKYILIDQDFPLLILNEVLCVVEYREDGSSMNMMKQYLKNPQGFAFFRKVAMVYAPSWKDTIREAMHYVSSSIISRNKGFLKESPRKGVTVLAIPLGLLLYAYIQNTNKRMAVK
ncbi:glycosyltransferase [Paenibacillus sp. FSL H8-0548]|uniref:glycosyltransferase family 2 protein n=1 Tax=Paenibacillus sp. FSL H8-0548 TaxID=1920422 RepID=UPI00096CD2F7|nr:glycosyltransferase family 2 protein [Paenibacillus sp. FSL H8-0548]OMF35950.1 glycosyltransferase [Paenibacillus sp. FSL H8-0548]